MVVYGEAVFLKVNLNHLLNVGIVTSFKSTHEHKRMHSKQTLKKVFSEKKTMTHKPCKFILDI